MNKLFKTALLTATLAISSTVLADKAGDIEMCVDKTLEFSGVVIDEFDANYESNWISNDVVTWSNVTCEVSSRVYNLTVNGKRLIFKGFAGKSAYQLNNKLEADTNKAINLLESRIALLEGRMTDATYELRKVNPSLKAQDKYIQKGIKKATSK